MAIQDITDAFSDAVGLSSVLQSFNSLAFNGYLFVVLYFIVYLLLSGWWITSYGLGRGLVASSFMMFLVGMALMIGEMVEPSFLFYSVGLLLIGLIITRVRGD